MVVLLLLLLLLLVLLYYTVLVDIDVDVDIDCVVIGCWGGVAVPVGWHRCCCCGVVCLLLIYHGRVGSSTSSVWVIVLWINLVKTVKIWNNTIPVLQDEKEEVVVLLHAPIYYIMLVSSF